LRNALFVVLGLVGFATACSDAGLSGRVDALEQRVQKLEGGGAAPSGAAGKAPGLAAPADPEAEKAAADLLRAASQASEAMKFDEAKADLVQLKEKYPDTRPARAAVRLDQELAVIGKPAAPLAVDKVYQGAVPDLAQAKVAVVVFFDAANPQTKQQLTRLQQIGTTYGPKGMQVVAVMRNGPDGDTAVAPLLKEQAVTFPVAQAKGTSSFEYYGVTGTPAAVVVKGGSVAWRGHPARLSDALLAQLTGG
jgi:hypothetical protein